jgi:putative ABC transport system permease protein
MEALGRDIRYTLRLWGRAPAFTAIAVLTLALGIGANTTMFSVVNATLLRGLPFPEAERLMTIWRGTVKEPDRLNIISMPNFRDLAARSRTFEDMAIFDSAGRGYILTGSGEPEGVSGVRVTASFFKVLGVPPLHGRTFTEAEEQPGNDRVVVLSHALWTRRFAGDPSIVGQTIQIDGRAHEVVGVMPASFRFMFGGGGVRQLWVPAGWTQGDAERGSNSFYAIGRVRPGVTVAAARSELDTIGRALADAYPADNPGMTARVVPMTEFGVARLRPTLIMMLGVVGFVLLIACVNVANLLLARAAARSRELAIRSALGAGRGRIARQLLTESVLLAGAGGIGGVAIAFWGTSALRPILPRNLQNVPFRPVDGITIDPMVLLFTSAVAILSGILFGLAPALAAARNDLSSPLKETAPGSTGGRSRLRYALVASEVALTLVVLAGAGVMLASMWRLLRVDPGLDPKNVLIMDMSLPQANLYYGPPENPRFCEGLERHVGSIPGVIATSAIAHLPLGGGSAGRGIAIEGQPDPGPQNQPGAGYSVACPNLLRTLGIGLRAGREFTLRDTLEAPGVAVINETMARRYWPKDDAIGKRFKIGRFSDDAPWLTVVGVFADVRHFGLDAEPGPWFMRPYQQAGWPFMTIATKTASTPESFIAAVKQGIAAVEPNRPVARTIRTMEGIVGSSVSSRRFPMLLLSGFGLLALVLAAVGIAGVVGYSVVRRTQEIGLRMALGAQHRDVLRLILGQSLAWTMLGVAAGVAASFGLLRFLDTLLFGIEPTDPRVLAGVSILLTAVALIASYIPARRAMRIDAIRALREG